MSRKNYRGLKKKLKNKRLRTLVANVLGGLTDEINDMIRDKDQSKEGE